MVIFSSFSPLTPSLLPSTLPSHVALSIYLIPKPEFEQIQKLEPAVRWGWGGQEVKRVYKEEKSHHAPKVAVPSLLMGQWLLKAGEWGRLDLQSQGKLLMVAYDGNPSIWEAEAQGLQVQGKASLGYMVKSRVENKTKQQEELQLRTGRMFV